MQISWTLFALLAICGNPGPILATFNLSKLKKDNIKKSESKQDGKIWKTQHNEKIKFAAPFLNCGKNYEQGGEEIGGYWSI